MSCAVRPGPKSGPPLRALLAVRAESDDDLSATVDQPETAVRRDGKARGLTRRVTLPRRAVTSGAPAAVDGADGRPERHRPRAPRHQDHAEERVQGQDQGATGAACLGPCATQSHGVVSAHTYI